MGNQCCGPEEQNQNNYDIQKNIDSQNDQQAQFKLQNNNQSLQSEFPDKINTDEMTLKNLSQNLEPTLEDEQKFQIIIKSNYILENGAIYNGQMKEIIDQETKQIFYIKNGKGSQTWVDGAKYEGDWKDGQADGLGVFTHSNFDVYNGQFQKDRANGYGVYIHQNGQRYEGFWKDDVQEGQGREILEDGSIYEGQFKNGKKWGYGSYQWADNSKFQGDWINNNIEGDGEYTWPDGRIYKGQWKDNKLHGKGVYTWPDGRRYEGQYEFDKKHGYGAYYWPDGKCYDGQWKDGKQHGEARYTDKKGKSKNGIWENGERIKWIDNKSPNFSRRSRSNSRASLIQQKIQIRNENEHKDSNEGQKPQTQ